MVQFSLVNFTSLGMNVAVFYLLVNVLGPQFGIQLSVWKTISVIISGTAICAWNFLGYKFIVFKK